MVLTYPSVFALRRSPQASDGEYTATLEDQRSTEGAIEDVLDRLPPASVPRLAGAEPDVTANAKATTELRKSEHTQFLARTFFSLPAGFVALDASKPWLMFWTVHSLDILGVALDRQTKERAVRTVLHYLSPKGGFAGGAANSHIAHLLPTYAAVLSLAITGHSEPGGGWDRLVSARQDMYDFFMRCKRPDGSFVVCEGGEVDVRGTYCLLVVATLLDLLTPELLHNVDKFIAACQTYEGGFACSSFAFPDDHRTALAEAHGGYTSCSVFSHFLLKSVQPPEPLESLPAAFPVPIDVDSALRWNSMMQGDACEAGGFRGRTNKLVDGCYSWWVGGTFPILEDLHRKGHGTAAKEDAGAKIQIVGSDDGDADWDDELEIQSLFNRVALQEYTLLAAQRETGDGGGLRDKPGKRPDLYHTCNNLSGLSVAQHHLTHSEEQVERRRTEFKPTQGWPAVTTKSSSGDWKSEQERQMARREAWANVQGWIEHDKADIVLGGKDSRVNATIPPFNVLDIRLEAFVNYFYRQ